MNMVNGNYFGKIHNVIEQYLEGRKGGWKDKMTGGDKSKWDMKF